MRFASLWPQDVFPVLIVEADTSDFDLSCAFAFPLPLYGVDTRVAADSETSSGRPAVEDPEVMTGPRLRAEEGPGSE